MSELVPDDWSVNRLDQVSRVVDSAHQTPVFSESGYPMVRVGDINGGKITLENTKYVPQDVFKVFTKNHRPAYNDLLMTRVGSYGRCSIVKSAQEFCLGQNTVVINPKSANSDYLYQFLQTDNILNQIEDTVGGSSQKSLSLAAIKSLKISIPVYPEQQKIAAILTSVDEVIEKTQAQIGKLKDLKAGMMQQLLTSGVGVDGKSHAEFKDSAVGRIPHGWEVVDVGSLVDVIDPQPDHRTPAEVENGFPYVGLGDIDKSGEIDFAAARKVSSEAFNKQLNAFEIHDGAFIFGKIGTIGNPSVLPKKRFYCLSANVVLVTCIDVDITRYIHQVFTSDIINNQVALQTNTTSQPALGIKKVRGFVVPLPAKAEMKSIVKVLTSIDMRLSDIKEKSAKFKDAKKALMQDLLTGKVRVTVPESSTGH